MSLKNFQWEKIFQIPYFSVLKHVLDHSKSISTKKNSEFFRFFGHFLPFLAPKMIFWIFEGKISNCFSYISNGLYCCQFALLHISLRQLSSSGSLDLSNFWPKMDLNRDFSKILGRKKIFFENFFYRSFVNNFVNFLSYQTYMYLYPLRRAHQMSKFIPASDPSHHTDYKSLAGQTNKRQCAF